MLHDRGWFATALLLSGLAAPWSVASAQNTTAPVGPAELRDFSLPGTVVTPPPEPEPQTAPPPEAQTPPPQAAPEPAQEPAAALPRTSAPQPRVPAQSVPPASAETPPTSEPGFETLPELDMALPADDTLAEPAPALPLPPPPLAEENEEEQGSDSWIYWLLAALGAAAAIAGAAKLWQMRPPPPRRSPGLSTQLAARPNEDAQPALPEPRPAAEPAAVAMPAAAAAEADDEASRPRVEILFKPARAEATDAGASVHYDLVVKNLGSETARNVSIEARMFSAGPEQEKEVGAFFRDPLQKALVTRAFEIPARSQAKLSRTVSMARELVRPVTLQGRSLFVPMVAFNIVYDWGDGRIGQTSRCYVVGRETETPNEKMGAFRLDLGPRVYRSVGQRQTSLARIA